MYRLPWLIAGTERVIMGLPVFCFCFGIFTPEQVCRCFKRHRILGQLCSYCFSAVSPTFLLGIHDSPMYRGSMLVDIGSSRYVDVSSPIATLRSVSTRDDRTLMSFIPVITLTAFPPASVFGPVCTRLILGTYKSASESERKRGIDWIS